MSIELTGPEGGAGDGVAVPLVTIGVFGVGAVFQVEYCQCLNGFAATRDKRVSRLSPVSSLVCSAM